MDDTTRLLQELTEAHGVPGYEAPVRSVVRRYADVPGISRDESAVRMGQGPSNLIYDARMIPNMKLRDLFMDTAAKIGVSVQTSAIEGGATDGAAIHLHRTGVPTVVLSVPARHIHSHSSIIHRADYDQAVRLLAAVLQKLDADCVAGLAVER